MLNRSAHLILATLLGLCLGNGHAAQDQDCAPVLLPTEEQIKTDYSMMQAYMRVSAGEEYDRLKKVSKDQLGAEASYKLFSAEFDSSSSREEFQEKIRKRLDTESFSLSVSDAKAVHRKYLSNEQLTAWTTCIIQKSKGGALLLRAIDPAKDGFALSISWIPQTGVPDGDLELEFSGAKVDGLYKYKVYMPGKTDRSVLVKPDQGASAIVIVGNIRSNDDSIRVRFDLVPTKPPLEVGGMLGDTLTVARRYPTKTTPYWLPTSTISVATKAGSAEPGSSYVGNSVSWGASISAGAREIRFKLPPNPSEYITAAGVFDGFIISGFSKPIRSVIVRNSSNLVIDATNSSREIHLAIAGKYAPNTTFSIRVVFDE